MTPEDQSASLGDTAPPGPYCPPGAELTHSTTLPASVDGEAFAGEESMQEVARVKEEDNSAPAGLIS